jgi:hypothetical protein
MTASDLPLAGKVAYVTGAARGQAQIPADKGYLKI